MKAVHPYMYPQGTFEYIISATSAMRVKMYRRTKYIRDSEYICTSRSLEDIVNTNQ